MTNIIGFRPTEKAKENIKRKQEQLKNQKKRSDKTGAINEILESWDGNPTKKQEKEGDFFTYPPFLYCPKAKTWLLKETLLTDKECQRCSYKKLAQCPAWTR